MPTRELVLRAQRGKSRDPAWYRVHRRLSIYITLWLLPTVVRPVQVTVTMMVVWLVGAALVAAPSLTSNLWGFALLYLSFLLDKVDGELARLRGAESAHGILLDRIHHRIVEPTVFLAVAWRDFALRGDAVVLAAGFATAMLANILEEQQQLPPYIFFKRLGEGWTPSLDRAGAPPAWRRARAWLRPLKVFRMPLTAMTMLFLCRVGEALLGRPLVALELEIGVVALTAYLGFQCLDYYRYRLQEDFVEIAARHGWTGTRHAAGPNPGRPPPAHPRRSRADISIKEEERAL